MFEDILEEQKDLKLNYDMPIFCLTLNVMSASRQAAENLIKTYSDNFKLLNMQCLILPVHTNQNTAIKTLWKGTEVEKRQASHEFAKFINLFNDSNANIDVIKNEVRNVGLNALISDSDNTVE